MRQGKHALDTVEAYNRIAPSYTAIAEGRRAYLQAVEDLIVGRISPGTRSLLDIGGGDGKRAVAIAQRAAIKEVVVLEPSAGMRAGVPTGLEVWPIRAEEIPQTERCFHVITCLWNVLGHISREDRVVALSKMAALLTPEGRLFMDVNHRYNARAYGWFRTVGRWAYDQLLRHDRHGDVTVTWRVDGLRCSTYGHVFSDREFRELAISAGLAIEERIIVDYDTGQTRQSAWRGNLFYALRRQDSRASASDSQT